HRPVEQLLQFRVRRHDRLNRQYRGHKTSCNHGPNAASKSCNHLRLQDHVSSKLPRPSLNREALRELSLQTIGNPLPFRSKTWPVEYFRVNDTRRPPTMQQINHPTESHATDFTE